MKYLIEDIKAFVVFILLHRFNKINKEAIELLEKHYKTNRRSTNWIFNKIKELNKNMEKQTTAVNKILEALDWAIKEYEKEEIKIFDSQIGLLKTLREDIVKNILPLERQQIEEAYLQGFCEYNIASMDFEQYFKQTFK